MGMPSGGKEPIRASMTDRPNPGLSGKMHIHKVRMLSGGKEPIRASMTDRPESRVERQDANT